MAEKYLNKKREDLRSWFRREAKPLAESYEAVLRLLGDKSFPDRIPLIAHELREINNSLPEILDPISKRDRVEYEEHLNKISPNWPAIPSLDSEEIENSAEKPVSINMNVALQIDALVQDHRKSQQPFNQFGILFGILMRKKPSQADVNLKILQDFKSIHRKFVKWSKKRSLMKRPVTEEELHKQFNKFEDILHSFVGSFFGGTERLDELLKKGIQPDQIDELLPLIASPHHEAYFFNNLNDPKLIPFLKKMGMFDKPFKTETLRGGGIRYPVWPHSRYLARMAHASPDEAAEIFIKMDTDNASVIRDIVSSALSAPAKVASKLVPKICQAAESGLLILCFEDAVTLCVRLAEDEDVRSAELLAIALFTPRMKKLNRTSWDEHQYREGLEKVVLSPLSASSKFLEKLCIWMHLFIESEKRFDPESGNDYSFLWRPAIEDHSENHDYHRASSMVSFVRDSFELAIENKRMSLDSAFEIIDRQNYLVFKRIKLHLINKFAEQNSIIAREAILNRAFFEQGEYKHEYAKLVENRFSLLNDSDRKEWFAWIENGPGIYDLKDLERDATEEQISCRKRYWKYGKLHWAREHLNGAIKADYEALKGEFGNLVLPDLNISSYAGMIGSPIKTEDLSKLSFKEAVKTVAEWRSDSQSLSGIEELAGAFQEYAAVQAMDFSKQTNELIGRPAIFISKFISAMSDGIKSGSDIDINAVLDLCLWAVSCLAGDSTISHKDKYWIWARSEIALFIKAVCQATENDSPKYHIMEFRTKLWQLINFLCQLKEEVVFLADKDNDPRNEDYIQTGINSLKGQAMEAALEYARWIFNHFKQSEIKADSTEFAEVMDLLESRLTAEDRTPGELALIGSNIHLLYAIDKIWLKKQTDAIFPLGSSEPSLIALEWAAWNAFLSSSHPHIEFYRLFEKQFAYAAEQVPFIQAPKNGSAHNPVYRLGEHLIILYVRGELLPSDEKLSLRKFLSTASPDVRCHTIEFIGRLLERHSEISESVEERCMELWELYWTDSGKDDVRTHRPWPFESWLACRKFPKAWCLEQFEKYLQTAETPEINSWAMEELAWVADADFKKSMGILDTIVRGDKEGWHILGWQDSIYSILEAVLKKDPGCNQSRQLVDYLGRSGYMKFKSLVF